MRPRVRALVVVEPRGLRYRAGGADARDGRDLGQDRALVGLKLFRQVSDRELLSRTSHTQ